MRAVYGEDLKLLIGDTPYPAGNPSGLSIPEHGDGALKISERDLTNGELAC
jgi:hypothetical protein